jgi:hypothetical protein
MPRSTGEIVEPAPVQPIDFDLAARAVATFEQHQKDFVRTCNDRIARAQDRRQVFQDMAYDLAERLFTLYPITTADSKQVPLEVYRTICMTTNDEDECIRKLYHWVEQQDTVVRAEDLEVDEPEEEQFSNDEDLKFADDGFGECETEDGWDEHGEDEAEDGWGEHGGDEAEEGWDEHGQDDLRATVDLSELD